MKRVLATLFSLLFITTICALDANLVPSAEAGVLVRNQRRILIRLRRLPRMHLAKRYPTSSKVIGRTNPALTGTGRTVDASKQIENEQKAEEDYNKKYEKWRQKQIKFEKRRAEKERKDQHERALAAKKARENQIRKARKVQSIKDAPLNPWFGSKKAESASGTADGKSQVMDLGKGKDDASAAKAKDPNRRVPLLKQIWHAIFG